MRGIQRFALGVQYDGTFYHGWQIQESLQTLQGALESALSAVANHPVAVVCAGRTDAGVHATGQVVHFESQTIRHLDAWVLGTNSNLPLDIRVIWVVPVSSVFHARFSATMRRYQYFIYNRRVKSAVMRQGLGWCYRPLNAEVMHRAAQHLVGEHDFSSFRGAGCQAKHPVRTITHVSVVRVGPLVCVDISANAFLLHMVRNIVGVLMEIGTGIQDESWIATVLAACDRKQGGITASPHGLYLISVSYPAAMMLPQEMEGPWFGGGFDAITDGIVTA